MKGSQFMTKFEDSSAYIYSSGDKVRAIKISEDTLFVNKYLSHNKIYEVLKASKSSNRIYLIDDTGAKWWFSINTRTFRFEKVENIEMEYEIF